MFRGKTWPLIARNPADATAGLPAGITYPRHPIHPAFTSPLMSQTQVKPRSAPTVNEPERWSYPRALPGETTVVWMLWLTYGAFYFCRQNLSAAVKGMEGPRADGGRGL